MLSRLVYRGLFLFLFLRDCSSTIVTLIRVNRLPVTVSAKRSQKLESGVGSWPLTIWRSYLCMACAHRGHHTACEFFVQSPDPSFRPRACSPSSWSMTGATIYRLHADADEVFFQLTQYDHSTVRVAQQQLPIPACQEAMEMGHSCSSI